MSLRQESGWVEEAWQTPDPDLVDDSLAILAVRDGSAADVVWHHIIDIDPEEKLLDTARMKMALARYGRQSLLQWDDVPVSEIRFWYDRLKELFENERSPEAISED